MARKTQIVTCPLEGRDKGKTYFILEMPPRQAEKWATRALLALGRAGGVDMPDDMKEQLASVGMAGIAALGIRAFTSIDFDDAEPLLDEMLECVTFVADLTKVDQMTGHPIRRALIEDDIEEVATLPWLRSEVITLHTGFSIAAFLSRLGNAAKGKWLSPDTPTSPPLSEPS